MAMKTSLKDTLAFKVLNLDRDISMLASAKDTLPEKEKAIIITDINNKTTGPIKRIMIERLNKGTFKLVSLPMNLLTWTTGDGVTYINLLSKLSYSKDGSITYNIREIFGLASVGLLVNLITTNAIKYEADITFIKEASKLFTKMIYTIISSTTNISTSSIEQAKIQATIAFYFIHILAGKSREEAHSAIVQIMTSAKNSPISQQGLMFLGSIETSDIDGFDKLINYLGTVSVLARDSDTTAVLRRLVTTYGDRILLGLENFPYFIALVYSVLLNANVLKDYYLFSSIFPSTIKSVDKITSTITHFHSMD
jgi:hypothetical protein